MNEILRGLNLISSDSYTNTTFCLKYFLANRLNVLRILVLPLRHNHLAGSRNSWYGGRTEDSSRIAGRLGFSTCKPRSTPYNSTTPKERATFIKKMKSIITRMERGRRAGH